MKKPLMTAMVSVALYLAVASGCCATQLIMQTAAPASGATAGNPMIFAVWRDGATRPCFARVEKVDALQLPAAAGVPPVRLFNEPPANYQIRYDAYLRAIPGYTKAWEDAALNKAKAIADAINTYCLLGAEGNIASATQVNATQLFSHSPALPFLRGRVVIGQSYKVEHARVGRCACGEATDCGKKGLCLKSLCMAGDSERTTCAGGQDCAPGRKCYPVDGKNINTTGEGGDVVQVNQNGGGQVYPQRGRMGTSGPRPCAPTILTLGGPACGTSCGPVPSATGIDGLGGPSVVELGVRDRYVATFYPAPGDTAEDALRALKVLLDENGLPATYDACRQRLTLDDDLGDSDEFYWSMNDAGLEGSLGVGYGATVVPDTDADGCPPFSFLCYAERNAASHTIFPRMRLSDVFEDAVFDVEARRHLCTPANESGRGVVDPVTHLRGFLVRPSKGTPPFVQRLNVGVTNELGTTSVDVLRRNELLAPTTKSLTGPPPPPTVNDVDHFKCYKVRRSRGETFPPLDVFLSDQFISPPKRLTVVKPSRLCAPVGENGAVPAHPDRYLLCYKARPCESTDLPQEVFVNSEFGPETLSLRGEDELCVPSTVDTGRSSSLPAKWS